MNLPGEIHFHYLKRNFTFKKRKQTKRVLEELFKIEGQLIQSINYIFCSDDYLHELNQGYLNHDTYTDIITFELSQAKDPLLADIFISIDRVKVNAHLLHIPFSKELLRVMIHGALHLCSYDDKSMEKKKKMSSKEDEYLDIFVSRETAV